MPPFGLKRFSKSKSTLDFDQKEDATIPQSPASERSAPPEYAATNPLPEATVEELTRGFKYLTLHPQPDKLPRSDEVMAHLKLLEAIFALKEEIGYTDGLFDLWDSRALGTEESTAGDDNSRRQHDEALSKIREKRWALYVLRAVDRFEVWWHQFLCSQDPNSHPLVQQEMVTPLFGDFPLLGSIMKWNTAILPPLDVLMVWHAFMLNPRDYLEDCMKFSLPNVYATGMPWIAVNDAIDTQFNYRAPEAAQKTFANMTGRNWDNAKDPPFKELKCPRCPNILSIPWTTCGLPETFDPYKR